MIRRITIPALVAVLAALQPLAAHAQQPAAADSARRDSAQQALYRAFRHEMYDSLAAAGVDENTHGLLMVEGRRAGPELQVRVLEGELPDSTLQRFYNAVAGRAAGWPRDTLHLLMRLDVDRPGDDPQGREHLPGLRNRSEIADAMSRWVSAHRTVGSRAATFRLTLKMVVSRAGEAVFVELAPSSGNQEVDTFMAGLARRMKFDPARIGDQRVDVWVTLPMTVVLPPSI